MLTTSKLRTEWGPHCQSGRGVTLSLNGEGRVHVDRRIADAVRALNQALTVWNYRTRRADTGAYNCRRITGGTGYSLHAYLIALDLNWQSNPYASKLITDMPPAMVGAILAIRTNSGAQVWGWGGNYKSVKDAMHWEIVCTRAAIASGINWATVPKLPGSKPATPAAPAKAPFSWVPTNTVRPGARGDAVWKIQFALDRLRPLTKGPAIKVDSVYGPATTAEVKRFQKFARAMQVLAGERAEAKLVDVDGIWGPQTGAAAKFWGPSAATMPR